MKTTIKKLEKSEIEIMGIIESSEFEKYEEKALERIGERLELPGFRKGKAPANIIKENIKEMELLEEMAEEAIYNAYPEIIKNEKIDAIGRPQIMITKIGKGADLEFKIITATVPEIKLADYKKIAQEENTKEEFKKEITVEEKDLEKVINDLRKMRAEQKAHSASKDNHEGHENMTEEEHAKAHEMDMPKEIPESEWPAFDDEFAKSFGKFETAEELKEKIKTNLKNEKEVEQKDKLRLAIVEELVKKSEIEVPQIIIDGELDKMLYRLEADVTNMGFQFEEYLKQINKTKEDLRNEWKQDAEKRAKLQLIIHEISKKENLFPTEEEIKNDVDKIIEMYKEADPARAEAYVTQMLENEKVFAFLEKC